MSHDEADGPHRRYMRFRWNYIPLLSPEPVEFDPVLDFYLSTTVVNVTPLVHRVSISDDERLTAISQRSQRALVGADAQASIGDHIVDVGTSMQEAAASYVPPAWYAPEHLTYHEFTWDARFSPRIYRDVALNIDAFAYTYTNKGQLGLNEAGSTSIYLYELFQYTSNGSAVVLQKTLKVYNADGLVKGVLVLVVEPDFLSAVDLPESAKRAPALDPLDEYVAALTVSDDNVVAGSALERRPRSVDDVFYELSDYDYIGDNKELFTEVFRRYIMANHVVFSNTNSMPTWPFMKNIHSPMYSYRGITTPGLCFVLLNNKQATNPEDYYVNLLYIALRRHYKYRSLEQSIDYFEREATDEEVACILAEVVCIFSNYCNYMTDKAHTLRDEHTRYVGAADRMRYLPHANNSVGAENTTTHELLVRAMIAVDQTTAVAATAATDNEEDDDDDKLFESSDDDDDDGEVETYDDDDGDDDEGDVSIGDDETHYFDEQYRSTVRNIRASVNDTAMGRDGDTKPKTQPLHTRRKRVDKLTAERINDRQFLKLIESFSVWLRATGTGDCEDMAREILRHLWDLKTSNFQNPLLRKLQRIRREYVPLQTLKGVTSGAITDSLDQIEEMGAHMDITLVHGPYFMRLLENFNTRRPLFDRDPSFVTASKDRQFALPTLVCEGTGCLKPDGSPDEALACKLYVMKGAHDVFSDVKSMLHQPIHQSSSFYKTIQSALVHEMVAEGFGVGEVVFFTKHPRQRQYQVSAALVADNGTQTFAERVKNFVVDTHSSLDAAALPQSRRRAVRHAVRALRPVDTPSREGDVERELRPVLNRIGRYDHVEPNEQENRLRAHYLNGIESEEQERLDRRAAARGVVEVSLPVHADDSARITEFSEVAAAADEHNERLRALGDDLARHKQTPGYIEYNVGVRTLLSQLRRVDAKAILTTPDGSSAALDRYLEDYYYAQSNRAGTSSADIAMAATYGIKHTHLVNADTEQIMAYTMPDITTDEAARFERILAHNHPLEPLEAPRYNTLECEQRRAGGGGNVYLEQLKSLARYLNRRANFAGGQFLHVDFYFKYDQVNDDAERVRALRNLITRKKFIVDFDYFEEPVARNNEIGGYLLRFVVVKLRAVHRRRQQ